MSEGIQKIICNSCGSSRYFLVHSQPKKPSNDSLLSDSNKSYRISEEEIEKPEKIVRCSECGLCFAVQNKQLIKDIGSDYLNMVDDEYTKEEKGRREQSRIILSRIEKYKKTGRLLDIGCGVGLFLDEAKRNGFDVEGVELSKWARDYAKERFNIKALYKTFDDARFQNKCFDVIVMLDVIEHLEDPKTMLNEIWRILKNDGVLYISTPDIESVLSRMLGGKWWGINKYHLYYFSKKTLSELLDKSGFKPVKYSAYPRIFSLSYWAKRLKSYPIFIRGPITALSRVGNLGNKTLKIMLYDQIDVLVRKSKTIDTIEPAQKTNIPQPLAKQKVIAVLPAYNAAKTLERTVKDISGDHVDEIILVDDVSSDNTVDVAQKLGLTVIRHEKNLGYGGNQKTCYEEALKRGADIVVMVHPDYQYDPTMIPKLINPIQRGEVDAVFGSRMMKGGALEGGMPRWKYNANILLTAFENVILDTYLTEYHSGFRAYSSKLLKRVKFKSNSNNFVFDTEIIAQIVANHFKIDEVPIQTRYFDEASSITLMPSIVYGLSIVRVMLKYYLYTSGIYKSPQFDPSTE